MKDSTNTIATKLADQFEVDGNALKLKAGAYDSTLPETFGETAVDQAKGVHAHDKAYIPGFTKAAGEQAVDVLKSLVVEVTAQPEILRSIFPTPTKTLSLFLLNAVLSRPTKPSSVLPCV